MSLLKQIFQKKISNLVFTKITFQRTDICILYKSKGLQFIFLQGGTPYGVQVCCGVFLGLLTFDPAGVWWVGIASCAKISPMPMVHLGSTEIPWHLFILCYSKSYNLLILGIMVQTSGTPYGVLGLGDAFFATNVWPRWGLLEFVLQVAQKLNRCLWFDLG